MNTTVIWIAVCFLSGAAIALTLGIKNMQKDITNLYSMCNTLAKVNYHHGEAIRVIHYKECDDINESEP